MESSSESRVVTEAAPPWRVLQVNSEWCSVTGYTEAQWLGNTCRILQGPETCQRTVQVLNDALRAQRPITVRMVNYRADRTPFVNDLTIRPIPENAAPGAATHFVGIMRDHSLLEAVPRALVAPPCANMPASHPLSALSAQLLHPPSGAALQPTAQLEAQMALQQKTLQLLQERMKAQPAQGQPVQARPLPQPPFSGLPAAPAVGPAAAAPETLGPAQGVASGGAVKGEAAEAANLLWAAASEAPTAAAASQDLVQVAAAQLAAVAAAVTSSNAAAPQTEAGAVAAAAAALPARDEGDSGSTTGSTRVPPFLTKLYTIVQQPQPDDHVGWCDDGASFRVSDPAKFAARVLPRYFKHNKLGSFQQQLLTYGFHRLPNQSCLDISSVWMHPCFRRNQHHLLDHIQRQPAKSSARSAGSSNSSTSSSGSSSSGQTAVLEDEEEAPRDLHQIQEQLGSIQSSLHQLSSDMRTARTVELKALEALAERVCKRKRPASSPPPSLQGPGAIKSEEPAAEASTEASSAEASEAGSPATAEEASSAAGSNSPDDETVASSSAAADHDDGSASARDSASDGGGSGMGDFARGGDGDESGDGTLEAGTDSDAMPSAQPGAVGSGEGEGQGEATAARGEGEAGEAEAASSPAVQEI